MAEELKDIPMLVELYRGPLDGMRMEIDPEDFERTGGTVIVGDRESGELEHYAYQPSSELSDPLMSLDGLRAVLVYKFTVGKGAK